MSDNKETEEFSVELSEKEKADIEREVRKEIQREMKKAEAEKFRKAAKDRLLAEQLFTLGKNEKGEDLRTVDFFLGGKAFPKYAIIDGKVFHSGRSYTVNKGLAAVLQDQMWRAIQQEERRLGEKIDFDAMPQYRKVLKADGTLQLQKM